MSNKITAVIPVKGNSTRLPNKNILPFGDSNLLLHKINQLKQVEGLHDIICSSDSDEMLAIAENAGIKAIKRPVKYADESVPFGMFLEYVCDIVEGDHVMWACATSPCVEPYLYNKAIKTYFEKLEEGYDSLITCSPYQTYLMDEKGPLNFSMGLAHKNSEQLPMLYHFTNGINLAPTEKIREWHYNYGPNAYRLLINKREAADIDDVYDYEMAKALYAMKDPNPTV
ncbi:MAG: acylneuraminate cytidylyltransferase family protein [Lachnospiraceae bacterium]|nr:acylneuraminate cytidylyltransferase family protein [Lachnospiraceae bacterium]